MKLIGIKSDYFSCHDLISGLPNPSQIFKIDGHFLRLIKRIYFSDSPGILRLIKIYKTIDDYAKDGGPEVV